MALGYIGEREKKEQGTTELCLLSANSVVEKAIKCTIHVRIVATPQTL